MKEFISQYDPTGYRTLKLQLLTALIAKEVLILLGLTDFDEKYFPLKSFINIFLYIYTIDEQYFNFSK